MWEMTRTGKAPSGFGRDWLMVLSDMRQVRRGKENRGSIRRVSRWLDRRGWVGVMEQGEDGPEQNERGRKGSRTHQSL